VIVLHDRRIPGTRANIDHIAICRSGIYVIDAKRYEGKVQRIDRGGWFTTDLRLYVGRRECSKLIPGMRRQVEAVRDAVRPEHDSEIVVTPVLCFVEAEWSLLAKPFTLDGVWIVWPKALREQLLREGLLSPEQLNQLARQVASALPPA
jgi:Nuclease-related domain